MSAHVDIDRKQIADFCRRNHIRRLALFGSVLHDDFGPDSDVDVLVEFELGMCPASRSLEWNRSFPRSSAARWT